MSIDNNTAIISHKNTTYYRDKSWFACTTRPFAEKTIARFDLTDRIDFIAGSYLEDDLPGTYDVVWLSHILHGESPEDAAMIVKKAAAVLVPGGMIMIHEFILEDTEDRPLFPALFSLNMLLGTGGGRSYTQQQLTDMLEKAGAADITRTPFKGPTESGILMGTCP